MNDAENGPPPSAGNARLSWKATLIAILAATVAMTTALVLIGRGG